MAVKARAEITLTSIRDVQSVTRYYLLQSSTSAAPAKPTTNPPGGSWATSEPTYTSGSTNSLYFTDCTVFSDDTFVYSDVSLSSSYEAAKVAYNKAVSAEGVANSASDKVDENEVKIKELMSDGANLIIGTTYPDVSSAEKLPRIFGQPNATRTRSTSTFSVAEHGFRVTNTGTGYTYMFFGDYWDGPNPGMNGLIAGETYTLSADVTYKQLSKNTNTSTYYVRAMLYDDSVTTGTTDVHLTKNFGSITKNDRGVEKSARCEFTFTIPDNVTICYLAFGCNRTTAADFQAGDFIELRNLKLEKGSKATPWSSPVDWNAKIVSSANGKNTNTYTTKSSTGVITYPADAVAGDQLFVAEYGSTVYTTLYRFNGTSWENTQIGGMAVTQLDAGNVVSGTMSANRIKGDTLTLGGANNADGMLKVYDANGTLVGSFTREGLMAIAGTIGGWTIGATQLYNTYLEDNAIQHSAAFSPTDELQFSVSDNGTGTTMLDVHDRTAIYGSNGINFAVRTLDDEWYQSYVAPRGDDYGVRIGPALDVYGPLSSSSMKSSSLELQTNMGSYVRQPAMIMSGSTTISTGTSSKRATICTIPAEYQTGWRIIPFVTRTYGNSEATPADAGDFYYAYYNSADHKVCVKLANVLASGTAYTFDYMIYAVPLT